MTRYHLTTLVAALAVTLTAGVDTSYAQRGKSFGNFMKRGSSNNGGGNNGFNLNRSGGGLNFNNLNNTNRSKTGGNNGLNLNRNNNSPFQIQNNNNINNLPKFGNTLKKSDNSLQNRGRFNSIFNGINSKGKGNNNQNSPIFGIKKENLLPFGGKNDNKGGGLNPLIGNANQGLNINGNGKLGDKKGGKLFDLLKKGNIQSGILNGNFNGNAGSNNRSKFTKILDLVKHNQKNNKLCIDHDHWCHTKPKKCHWWYNWCKPIAYCDPHHHVYCHWNYVTCNYIVGGHVQVVDARWYLGLKGLLLPGQGIGIEEVTPGSPAAAVGLQPGMVITRCNGIDLVDEAAMAYAIEQSGGVLRMDLRLNANGPPATCVVVMQRVASVNF